MMKQVSIIMLLAAIILIGCGAPSTYVLFAQNAKSDDAMRHAITLRLPMERSPEGTMIACTSKSTRIFAKKLNDFRLYVRDPDGEEREVDLPNDGTPLGMVTYWPEGKADRCGLDPSSPIGAEAYVMWGEFTIFFQRMGGHAMKYWIGDDAFTLGYPLSDADRQLLRKKSVPAEVADLLF